MTAVFIGSATFMEDCVRDGHVLSFEHISSPHKDDTNKTKKIRLVKEHNPALASKLPGESWVVWSGAPALNVIQSPAYNPANEDDLVPLTEAEVHGSFANQSDAIALARQVARGIVAQNPGSQSNERYNEPRREFNIPIMKMSAQSSGAQAREMNDEPRRRLDMSVLRNFEMAKWVQVRYDRGNVDWKAQVDRWFEVLDETKSSGAAVML